MKTLKKFLIVKCPKCGLRQVTSAKTLKCKRCNKSTKIFQKKGLGLIIYKDYDTGTEANKFVTRLKNEILEQKEHQGFKTYEGKWDKKR